MSKKSINTVFFLQISLALVLISFGILAIRGYSSTGSEMLRGVNRIFGKSSSPLPVIFGIVQLAAGVFLLADLFVQIPSGLFRILHIIICLLWLISIIMNFFLSSIFEPDLLRWLANFSPQMVILLSLWLVGEEN